MSSDDETLWLVLGFGALAVGVWWFATKFVRDVATCIEAWTPPASPESETQLRALLAAHLRRALPTASVMEEFGAERSKVDIAVLSSRAQGSAYVERVAVELKYRLSRKEELDRLVGQVVGYKSQRFEKVMVVSVDPEPNLHEALKTREEVRGLAGYMMVLRK
ncbi:MAG: hypothetical protein NT125_08505 [Candidatus Bipolaricaulota bacterium]|nr:hypothetical protein [Candidatus Bipolaricaulota bacterium]